MCAFDLPTGESEKIFKKNYEENVIILICGDCSLRFRPHLNVTQEDLQFALDKIEKMYRNINYDFLYESRVCL
jgi:L-lysine 6-transaminase